MSLESLQVKEIPAIQLNEAVNQYLASDKFLAKRNPTTLSMYRNDLEQFMKFLKERYIVDIAQVDSQVIKDFQATFNSESTANRKSAIIRDFFRWVQKKGLVEKQPTIEVARLKLKPFEDFFTLAESKKLIQAANKNPRDAALIAIAIGTGALDEEILSLKNKDVVQYEKHLSIRFTRRNKDRLTSLENELAQVVRTFLESKKTKDSNQYLFPSKSVSGHTTRPTFLNLVNSYSEEVQRNHLNPRVLRYTFIMNTDLKSPQDLASHLGITKSSASTLLTRRQLTLDQRSA